MFAGSSSSSSSNSGNRRLRHPVYSFDTASVDITNN